MAQRRWPVTSDDSDFDPYLGRPTCHQRGTVQAIHRDGSGMR